MHRQLRLISTTDLDFFFVWIYSNWNRFGHFCLKGLSWCFEFAFSNLISDFWWTHFVPCLRSFLVFFFMCWFVMPITGCTVSFHCSFLFVHFWFLPCDLCNTCCGVPCLKLKDDVDLTCKYCIKKKKQSNVSNMQRYVKWPTGQNENHAQKHCPDECCQKYFSIFWNHQKKRTKIQSGKKLSEHYKGNVFINL